MGPSSISYLSNTAIFHFHDYGRKSRYSFASPVASGNASDSATDLDHDGNPVKKNATRRDQVNIAFGTGEAVREEGGCWKCFSCDKKPPQKRYFFW